MNLVSTMLSSIAFLPLNTLELLVTWSWVLQEWSQAHPDVPPPLAPLRAFKYTSAGGSRGGLLKLFTRVAGFPNFQNFWAGRLEKIKALEYIERSEIAGRRWYISIWCFSWSFESWILYPVFLAEDGKEMELSTLLEWTACVGLNALEEMKDL